jgi:hypothetical protein
MTIRAMLAAMLTVFTLASSAWAECAWVLWVRYEFINVTPGKLVDRGE